MDKDKATETIVPAIAPEGDTAPVLQDDAEARFQALEAEKENYRKAYLKEVEKGKTARDSGIDESDEEKMRRIAQEELANSRLSEITKEQDAIIQKTLKENRELKLAQLNKNTPPAAMGTHSESTAVRDTLVTPEQMAVFKAKGWTDKDIEAYKKNLSKRV